MVIGSIFLILALAVVAFLFVTQPLFEPADGDDLVANPDVQQREILRSTLLSERDRLLNTLMELDADNVLGKIPPGEYTPLREKMVHEAADILRQLDEINLNMDRISKPALVHPEEDDLEALIAFRRQALAGNTIRTSRDPADSQEFCTHCGNSLIAGDKYCPVCGTRVS